MRADTRYAILVVLVLGVVLALGLSLSGPLLYTLEKDTFPSRFHENTDVLKIKSLNSTSDIFPMFQDLIDFSGPIVLNIHIRDFDEARRLLENFAKSNIKVSNLVVSLDMSESEMEEFSKSNARQRELLQELFNQTISLDELKSLEIRYRDENRPELIMSVQYEGEAIRRKIHELYEQYNHETENIIATSKKFGLDTRDDEQSVTEFKKIIEEIDSTAPEIEPTLPRIPTLSLLIKPERGTYLDTIGLSGIYSSNAAGITRQGVTIFIDNSHLSSVTTDKDGLYHSAFQIEQLTAGLHSLYATSGLTSSGFSTLNVTMVQSTTSLEIQPVPARPEVRCTGTVMANKPVRNAPVDLVSDFRTIVRLTTNTGGAYESRIRFSPGIHRLETRFVNDSYPIFSSKSPIYEIEASQDSILSIRLIDAEMSADELLLTIDPTALSYRDTLNISGTLSGKAPDKKLVEIYIDGSFYRTLQTKNDGTYTGSYIIDQIKAGNHTIFAHYREPDLGELYSEPGHFSVIQVNSSTMLEIAMTDGGTALVCRGNITAGTQGVASAPGELVWDEQNSLAFTTDAAGSFRQKITLPNGNHTLYARFNSRLYPINPSTSSVFKVEILPPLDLYVRPPTVRYMDVLMIGGSLHGMNTTFKEVQLFIDGRNIALTRTDKNGDYTSTYTIERIAAGIHEVRALSGNLVSEPQNITVQPVDSQISLSATLIPGTSRVTCSGYLTADTIPFRSAPVLIIWDGTNVIKTETDLSGYFEETLTMPAGKHSIKALFNQSSIFPVRPSESSLVSIDIPAIEIPGNLTLYVLPDHGVFGESVTFTGQLSGIRYAKENVDVIIDGKKLEPQKTNEKGIFLIQYPIEQIPSGTHPVQAVSENFRSEIKSLRIFPVPSEITLTPKKIENTSRVRCQGTLRANNLPVRSAQVTIVWDEMNTIETITDKNGEFEETIIMPAGKHRLKARFNSTDVFPLYPSESAPVDVEIFPALSLDIRPASGIYKDTLAFQGTLIRIGQLEGSVDIFIDNNYLATLKTDATGRYYGLTLIERMLSGRHTAQARSGEISSDPKEFQVLTVPSRTTLLVTRIQNSSLVTASGSVLAFDRSGTILRKPLTILDVQKILSEFWKNSLDMAKRPVSLAPVEIILDTQTIVETQTDALGNFSEVLSLPAGSHTIYAQFINNSYPITKSQSNPVEVNIASANLSTISGSEQSRISVLEPLVIAVILILFIGGAVFYLQRKSGLFTRLWAGAVKEHGPDIPVAADILDISGHDAQNLLKESQPDDDAVSKDSIFLRYLRFLRDSGLSSAARNVYLHFTGRIAKRLHIARPRTLTPREFLRTCDQKRFAGAFSSFVSIYEQVRYGGVKTPQKKEELEDSIKTTDESLEREDH